MWGFQNTVRNSYFPEQKSKQVHICKIQTLVLWISVRFVYSKIPQFAQEQRTTYEPHKSAVSVLKKHAWSHLHHNRPCNLRISKSAVIFCRSKKHLIKTYHVEVLTAVPSLEWVTWVPGHPLRFGNVCRAPLLKGGNITLKVKNAPN